MKGFGFPSSGINGSNAPYRADTSQKKSELINVLTNQKNYGTKKESNKKVYLFIV